MNAERPQIQIDEATDSKRRDGEKEEIWQQIQQHFQTTQSALLLRLVCQGKVIQQIGDVKSGIKEASRMFTLQNDPSTAADLVASQENQLNRKCQQWEQAAKAAEAQERAKATGGSAGAASSAGNRRKLESENNAVRNRITSAKQCIRRLRTALNRGVSLGSRKDGFEDNVASTQEVDSFASANATSPRDSKTKLPTKMEVQARDIEQTEIVAQKSRLKTCLETLIGNGLTLSYEAAPFKDPFCDEGLKSREAIWTEKHPFCLIVQWEDSHDCVLNLKFWFVPKRSEYAEELRTENPPELYLHKNLQHAAEKLDLKLVSHNTQHGPLTSEMNQLLNQIESARFLSSESKTKRPLTYLTGSIKTGLGFDAAVKHSYLLELP